MKKQKKEGIIIIASGNPAVENGDDGEDNEVEDRDDEEKKEGVNDIEMINERKVAKNHNSIEKEGSNIQHVRVRVENEEVDDRQMINERKVEKSTQTEEGSDENGVDDRLTNSERKVEKSTQTEEGSDKYEVDDILIINKRKVESSTQTEDGSDIHEEIKMLNNKIDNLMGMFAGQTTPYDNAEIPPYVNAEIPPYINNDIPPLSPPICYDSIMDIDMPDLHAILNATLPLDSGSKALSKPSSKPSSKTVEEILKITYRDPPKLARDLARAVFGSEILRCSTITGRQVRGMKTSVLDMEKLLFVKGLVKSKYSSLSVVEFELVWGKCIKSIADLCKKLRDDHIILD